MMFVLHVFSLIFSLSVTLSSGQQCGKLGGHQTSVVVGGSRPDYMRYPWLARLEMEWQVDPKYFEGAVFERTCGASLIDSQHLVSAAHCVTPPEESNGVTNLFKVHLGDFDLGVDDKMEQALNVSKMVIHDKFDEETLINDIALLKLERELDEVEQALFVPICLPEKNAKVDNDNCWISGWGKAEDAVTEASKVISHVKLPFHPEACQELDFICAGDTNGHGACEGDPGGPLQCARMGDERMVLMGVASAVDDEGCEAKGVYNYFTKTEDYLKWIEQARDKLKL